MRSNYKKLSSHGSINIPVAMRREMGLLGGDAMEVSSVDGTVVVRPYKPRCAICGTNEGSIHRLHGKHICAACADEAYRTVKEG
jgi:transcriptional pleiotropic regulator of transition state genes